MANKKLKELTLNGMIFTDITKSKTERPYIKSIARSIYYAYEKPSAEKIHIWERWENWAIQLPDTDPNILACDLWVCGKNCMTFSIGGTILFENGKTASIKITKGNTVFWLD